MTTYELYHQAIKLLPAEQRLHIAKMILDDLVPENAVVGTTTAEAGFDFLKRLLPQVERISLTEQDLASVTLNGSEI